MCVCLCVGVSSHTKYSWRPGERARSARTGVTRGCEPLNTVLGTKLQPSAREAEALNCWAGKSPMLESFQSKRYTQPMSKQSHSWVNCLWKVKTWSRKTYSRMFVSALFTIVQDWREFKNQSIQEWMDTLWTCVAQSNTVYKQKTINY